MQVIVCGAGQVGANIARYLALEKNDVTVIDQSPDLVRRLTDTLDVNGVVGHASYPNIMEKAGARDADIIIAVTRSDEINMVACQIAHSVFNLPTKIARVRQQTYLNPLWANIFSRDHLPIDVIISPEKEVARAVARRLRVPGAFEVIPLVDGKVSLVGVRCGEDCPLLHTPLRQITQLFPDLNIVIVGLVRDSEARVPSPDDDMVSGDEVYFVVDSAHLQRAMVAFGHEEQEARRLIILGGGSVGFSLARLVETDYPWVHTKIIEANAERAEKIAGLLDDTVVIHGDVLDPEILAEANVSSTETVVGLTNDDKTNILATLLAKRYGAQRTVALMNEGTFEPLVSSLDIDALVNPRSITVSTILRHVRRGRIYSVHSLRDGFGELIEGDALETSGLVGSPLSEVKLPPGVMVGAVVRDDEVTVPRGSTVIMSNDRVVLFAAAESVRKVEKMFSVRLEYF